MNVVDTADALTVHMACSTVDILWTVLSQAGCHMRLLWPGKRRKAWSVPAPNHWAVMWCRTDRHHPAEAFKHNQSRLCCAVLCHAVTLYTSTILSGGTTCCVERLGMSCVQSAD